MFSSRRNTLDSLGFGWNESGTIEDKDVLRPDRGTVASLSVASDLFGFFGAYMNDAISHEYGTTSDWEAENNFVGTSLASPRALGRENIWVSWLDCLEEMTRSAVIPTASVAAGAHHSIRSAKQNASRSHARTKAGPKANRNQHLPLPTEQCHTKPLSTGEWRMKLGISLFPEELVTVQKGSIFSQHLSLITRLLNRVPSRLVLTGALLCLSGKADALGDSTQNGCCDTFIHYLVPVGIIGTVFHGCLYKGGLLYLMGALSLSWPMFKTDSRSPAPLIYALYFAHLSTTAAYGYVSFRDHDEPRRPLFLSVLLCATTSLVILFWSPTGMESLVTFLPPVLSLSVFIVAYAALIGSILRGVGNHVWGGLCRLVRCCLDGLGSSIQSVGQLLQRPTSGRDADEESLLTVASEAST